MKWFLSVAGLAALLLTACTEQRAATPAAPPSIDDFLPKQAQPRLQTMKLYMGTAELTAELCLDDASRMSGMMHRTNMPPDEGMLFVFPQPHQTSFWMKNTPLPLSAAYINPAGVIEEIHELRPFDTNSALATSRNIQFVLEVNRGWFASNNISTGAVVRTERGELRGLLPLVR